MPVLKERDRMTSLMRKVVIVTGASSGIGAASAVELAKHSARLVLHGRNKEALDAIRLDCINTGLRPGDVVTVTGDLNDDSTIKSIVQTARNSFGTLHVLFNNAGYIHKTDAPIHMGGTVQALDAMYRVNVRAPYMLIQESLPELEKNQGVVINCSSGYSRVADPNLTAYCLTKAAMDHMTRLVSLSLGLRGIRVNALNPGYVSTGLVERKTGAEAAKGYFDAVSQGSPFEQRLATPEEIGRVVVFLASDQSSALTGETVFCDLGATLTNPIVDFTRFK